MIKLAKIQLDPRNEKPRITNDMKAVCISEHSFTITEPCPVCVYHLDRDHDDIPCLCNGSEDKCYEKAIIVPWTTSKKIYQDMASVAIREVSEVHRCGSVMNNPPTKSIIKKFIINLTYPLWKPIISATILRMYEQKDIDSKTMHKVSAYFDDTQSEITFSWMIKSRVTYYRKLKD